MSSEKHTVDRIRNLVKFARQKRGIPKSVPIYCVTVPCENMATMLRFKKLVPAIKRELNVEVVELLLNEQGRFTLTLKVNRD